MQRHVLRPDSRRGFTAVYCVILLSVMTAFCSFAVDYGRAQLVKSQLRHTADAAARAACANISTGITAAQNAAVSIAALNEADGTPVVLDANADVEFGTWNTSTKAFTLLSGSARSGANAMRITARRTAARGTAVPMMFARLVGKTSCDVSASCTAYITQPASTQTTGPGFVGLSAFNSSNITTDAYDASAGTYASQSHPAKGHITSNDNIYAWNSTINGNARPGAGKTVSGGSITGSTTPLTSTLSYPSPTFPASNNNANITALMHYSTGSFSGGNLSLWGAITLPGGTYVLTDANISAPITFTGPAKLYCTGQLNVNGSGYLGTYQNKPANLLLVAGSQLNLYPAQPFYADIYSPNAQLNTSPGGTSHFYGQIIVKQWYVYNMNLHYDTSLPDHSPSGGGFTPQSSTPTTATISIVR